MERTLPTTDKTCGLCASIRPEDGYCRSTGRYVHAWDEKPCYHEPEPEPEPAPRKPKTKTCKHCGRTLTLDQFPKHNTSRDGRDGVCMDCKRAQMIAAQAERDRMRLARIGIDANGDVLPEGMRRCSKCHRVLPVTEFGVCKKNKDGIQYECKECRNDYSRALYRSHHTGEMPVRRRGNPKPKGEKDALTDAEMVEALRAHGWTVNCTRKVEEAL